MAKVKPFAALRPHKDHAKEVSSPPFDAGSKEAAYNELQANPHSYLNVVKPYLHFKGEKKNVEKHFPLGLQYLKQFIAEGFLVKEEVPAFYIYRLITDVYFLYLCLIIYIHIRYGELYKS
jgi:uncharacterized protein (DUF1015 family)